MQIALDALITLLVTLVGAFTGAWAAFKYQEYRETLVEKKNHAAAVNRALHTIYNLWNIQHQYQLEVINPCRGAMDAWLNMEVTLPPDFGLTEFQAEELSSLLETSHAQTYADLMLDGNRFKIAMNLINIRSTVALNEAWPKLGATVKIGEAKDESELVEIIGADVTQKLRKPTEGIIEHIDENEKSIRVVHDRLREGYLDVYPNGKIIRIEFTGAT